MRHSAYKKLPSTCEFALVQGGPQQTLIGVPAFELRAAAGARVQQLMRGTTTS